MKKLKQIVIYLTIMYKMRKIILLIGLHKRKSKILLFQMDTMVLRNPNLTHIVKMKELQLCKVCHLATKNHSFSNTYSTIINMHTFSIQTQKRFTIDFLMRCGHSSPRTSTILPSQMELDRLSRLHQQLRYMDHFGYLLP